MKQIYLVLAVLGAIVPYVFFLDFFGEQGFSLVTFVMGLFVNGAAGGFAADVLISSLVFWTFLIANKVHRPWVYIILNLTIGLSCALPAYLYAREAAREATSGDG